MSKDPIKGVFFLLVFSLFFQTLSAQKNYRKEFHKIDSILNSNYEENNPGIAIAIIKQGETIYKNEIGMADLENRISISDSTAFHIASVSKQFTGYLALLLEKEAPSL